MTEAAAVPAPLDSPRPTIALAIVMLGLTVFALIVMSLSIGMVVLSPADVLAALAGQSEDAATERISWDLRLPRVIAAAFGGAALAAAGLLLQTLFRNPLASPWTLGLTAGAQFGAALVVVAGGGLIAGLQFLENVSLVFGAAVGCLTVALLMLAAARRVGTVTLLVLGVMLGFLAQGLISVIMHFTSRTQGRIFASWNDGSFAGLAWADLPFMTGPIFLGLIAAILLVKPLNALLLGETYASSLGLHVPTIRRAVLGVGVLLAAPATAFCGPVLFLGLIVPHFCRAILATSDHRLLMPIVIPAGAALALAADLFVHLPWERHFLHLNAILAIIGAPAVIAMLLLRRDLQRLV